MKNRAWSWKWKPQGAPDAETAGTYIERIKRKRKGLTPQLLVIEAKSKKSPLHNCFEWNDTKAAELYRITQAQGILRMLVVEVKTDSQDPVQHRAFISPVETNQQDNTTYWTIAEVCNDEELSENYQKQLYQELKAVKEKIKSFPIFKDVVQAIEAIAI